MNLQTNVQNNVKRTLERSKSCAGKVYESRRYFIEVYGQIISNNNLTFIFLHKIKDGEFNKEALEFSLLFVDSLLKYGAPSVLITDGPSLSVGRVYNSKLCKLECDGHCLAFQLSRPA